MANDNRMFGYNTYKIVLLSSFHKPEDAMKFLEELQYQLAMHLNEIEYCSASQNIFKHTIMS